MSGAGLNRMHVEGSHQFGQYTTLKTFPCSPAFVGHFSHKGAPPPPLIQRVAPQVAPRQTGTICRYGTSCTSEMSSTASTTTRKRSGRGC